MACVWIEGFETHLIATQMSRKYASTSGSVSAQAGRVFGTAGAPNAWVVVTPSFGIDNTMIVGFGFRFASHSTVVNSGNQGLYFELGSDEQAHVEMESSSGSGIRFLIKRGATTVATSSFFDFGVWHYIEIKLVLRTGTNGAYELRHNGVVDISAGSVDLADTGGDGADVHAWRWSSNLSSLLRLDDIYVVNSTGTVNNDFLSPSIVEGLLPNADGATIEWTPSAAVANWTNVDDAGDASPDDAGVGGYNGSDTNSQIDLYAFADLQNVTGAIHAVQLGLQLGMGAAGTRTVRSKYRDPDTTVANGDSHVVDSTIFDEFTQVFQVNPASTAAWDVADIDGGQFGVEVVS